MIEIIVAVLSVLASIATAVGLYFKAQKERNSQGVINEIVRLQEHRQGSIKRKEEAKKYWKDIESRASRGELSHDDVNRMLSGQKPSDRSSSG